MDPGQRPALPEYILHDRREWRKFFPGSYDSNIWSNRARQAQGAFQQAPSLEFDKGLVRAHARAFSSSQNKSRTVDRGDAYHAAIIHSLSLSEITPRCKTGGTTCKLIGMPELPDVAAYIGALESRIVGQPIEQIRLASPFLLRTVQPPLASVEGHVVRVIRPIGKP